MIGTDDRQVEVDDAVGDGAEVDASAGAADIPCDGAMPQGPSSGPSTQVGRIGGNDRAEDGAEKDAAAPVGEIIFDSTPLQSRLGSTTAPLTGGIAGQDAIQSGTTHDSAADVGVVGGNDGTSEAAKIGAAAVLGRVTHENRIGDRGQASGAPIACEISRCVGLSEFASKGSATHVMSGVIGENALDELGAEVAPRATAALVCIINAVGPGVTVAQSESRKHGIAGKVGATYGSITIAGFVQNARARRRGGALDDGESGS